MCLDIEGHCTLCIQEYLLSVCPFGFVFWVFCLVFFVGVVLFVCFVVFLFFFSLISHVFILKICCASNKIGRITCVFNGTLVV